jgi:uncharacterized protein YjeT (DUF2065 family)
MPEVVLVSGMLITSVSLYLLVRPQAMAGLLDKVFGTRWLFAAALFRLMLGAALIASAPTVAFPRAIGLFGWLFVLGGLLLVAIPAPALRRVTGWFGQLSDTMSRLWLSGAVIFGLFIIYAAIA